MAKKYSGPGYQSYCGRRSSRTGTALKWVIVFLLAVLVVAVGFYFMLQDGLIYDDDGVHVALPWKRPETGESPSVPVSVSPEPTDAAPTDTILVIETPEPTPTLTPRDLARQTLQAVEVSPTVLLSGRAAQQVEQTGGNAALLEMKKDDGTLAYVSSVELAISQKASGSDTEVNRAIRELIEGECYTVAQVSCFRDDVFGGIDSFALLSNSGYRWRDFNGMRWSCAGKEATRKYIVDLCVELAQMGFDEILLTNCGYPPNGTGEMGWLRQDATYPWGSLDTVVGPFLAQVKTAIEPYGTALSVEALGKELAGEEQATGLTLDNVLASCDHVWLDKADAEAYAHAFTASAREKLVTVSAQAGGADEPWAVAAE